MKSPIAPSTADVPLNVGTPTIEHPPLLAWPQDAAATVDLTEAGANTLNDLHGEIRQCDLLLSTAGNYHMALKELWPLYARRYGTPANWLYTTSPPIAHDQVASGGFSVGNLRVTARPQVAVAPQRMVRRLIEAGFADGAPQPLYTTRGNALLVKKGNPKKIRDVFDLARPDVRTATPNPDLERDSFEVYARSIYGIAAHARDEAAAQELFDAVFNAPHGAKWYAGSRIHHREVPWSVALGHADVGILFYHLARHAAATFPDIFDIVPLGGPAHDPVPLPGTRYSEHAVVALAGEWSPAQRAAQSALIDTLLSAEFAAVLDRHGLMPTSERARAAT